MSVAAIAAALVAARRSGHRIAALGDGLALATEAEAYDVQEAVIRLLGVEVAGWKVGAAGPDAAPSAAPLLATLVAPSPARFAATADAMRAVEAELALRLGRDLPPRSAPYEADEAWAAVASVHVAIELLDSRFVDRNRMGALAQLADNLTNGGFCHGAPAATPRAIDFLTQPAALALDGTVVRRAAGGNPAGHPARLVAWLAGHCASRGRPLKAGTIITTGSHTGVTIAPVGARVTARFDGLGEAELSISAAQ